MASHINPDSGTLVIDCKRTRCLSEIASGTLTLNADN